MTEVVDSFPQLSSAIFGIRGNLTHSKISLRELYTLVVYADKYFRHHIDGKVT